LPNYLKFCIRAFILIAVGVAFTRLFFGIDFTDECQYVAEALGPLMGGKAFVTDRFFQQSGSLWGTPFLWAFSTLIGSTDGIVLFFRILYFGVTCFTGFLMFKAFRKSSDLDESLALSVLPVLYIPFVIPAMSYNTMALQMTLMSLALLKLLKFSKRIGFAVALGMTSAMAIFSYPTLALAYGCFFLLEYRDQAFRPWMNKILIFSILFLTLFSIPIFSIGSDELRKNFAVASAVSLFTWEAKWNTSMFYLSSLLPTVLYFSAAMVAAVLLWLLKKPLEFLIVPFLALFYFFAGKSIELDTTSGFIIYSVLGFLILASVQRVIKGEAWKPNQEVIMGLLVGLCIGLTSTNGFLNACLGFSVALIFMLEIAYKFRKKFPWFAWSFIVLFYVIAPWSFFYREGRLPELVYQVDSGPFLGLHTNLLKINFLKELEADLKALPPKARSIFVYDSFPAGYLFTGLRPQTFLYYMHPYPLSPGLRPELQQMLSTGENYPDAVLEILALPIAEKSVLMIQKRDQNISKDPFWGFFKNNPAYEARVVRPMYVIYTRKGIL
jgi:hypothetical protein